MELIREIESRRDKKGCLVKWGLYWCDFCKKEVEKRVGAGERCNSCGCHINVKHGGIGTKLYKKWETND